MNPEQRNGKMHANLVCDECGTIVDMQRIAVNISEMQKQGFDIENGHIEFFGICSSCRYKDKKSSKLRKANKKVEKPVKKVKRI